MLDLVTSLFDVMSVQEQTPVALKGMPCERLFIVKSGTVDVMSDKPVESAARCDVGLYFGEEMLRPLPSTSSSAQHGIALLASPIARGPGAVPASPMARRSSCKCVLAVLFYCFACCPPILLQVYGAVYQRTR